MEGMEALNDQAGKVKKLKELFGCTDDEARGYLEAFNYDIEKASAEMVSLREGPSSPLPPTTLSKPVEETGTATNSQMTSGNKDFIDLTSNPDDDLKRALQLSLEEQHGGGSGGISYEDQQLSRAVEQSLADTRDAAQMMGMSSVTFFTDPLNPHERKRNGRTPVGLKNLGNTCWFSVVVQALFHQPSFRRMVLEYSPPSQVSPGDAVAQQPHNLCITFVQELRSLFSLMIHSQRKYVDPGAVVKLLTASGAQQDMTEFIHKFLEWLEDAFAVVGKGEEGGNPMDQLFYGQCQTVGVSEGSQFVNVEKLGAYPLEVRGCTDLYESLAAATFSRYGTAGEPRRSFSHDSIHECWFSRLPPVMILELSRFEFDQTSKRVEKINDQLTFEQVLYMDRFLLKNSKDTLMRHSREVELRVKLDELKEEYQALMNYGGRPVPLVDLFSLMLKYTKEKVAVEEDDHNGVEVLQTKLQQWRAAEEMKLEGVKQEMDVKQNELSKLYADPIMTATPYRLHAVCVHQGDASLGHYWVYVNAETSGLLSLFHGAPGSMDLSGTSSQQCTHQTTTASGGRESGNSQASLSGMVVKKDDEMMGRSDATLGADGASAQHSDCDKWLKFNDVNVTAVTWEDVARESFGDSRNTSAYCLICVADDGGWEENGPADLEALPKDLQDLISQHNQEFEGELAAWDQTQQRPTQLPLSQPAAAKKQDGSSEAVVPNAPSAKDWTEPAASAELGSAVGMEEEMQLHSLSAKLDRLVQNKYQQMLNYYSDSFSDNRYLSVGTYCLRSGAPEYFCQLLILEYCLGELEDAKDVELLQAVQLKSAEIVAQYQDRHLSDKQQWCSMFQSYRNVCLHIISSAKALNEKMYVDAVDHAMAAYSLNRDLVSLNAQAGVNMAAIRQLLAYMAKTFHTHVLQLFASGDHSVLEHCLKWLVPCVQMMAQDQTHLMNQVTVSIRKEWCNRLEEDDLTENLLDRLADFLSALMEDNNQDLKWQTVLKAEVAENSFETVCKEYCLVLQELSSVS